MTALYKIDTEILACVDAETGEIFDYERFAELQLEKEAKIESICLWIKNLEAEATALKAEKDAFDQRLKATERKKESLAQYITDCLDGKAFETTRVKVSFRRSEILEVADPSVIPVEFLKVPKVEVDKVGLKKAVKGGLVVDGVRLVERQNLQIK